MALLLLCAGHVLHWFFHSPLNPRKLLSLCSGHHPTLLETWPQQRMMVYSLHIGGCEPLHFVPCFLESIIVVCWDPGVRPAVGPCPWPCCLQIPIIRPSPDLFLGWHYISHQDPITIGVLHIPVAFPTGDIGHRCCGWYNLDASCGGWDRQHHWISAGSINDASRFSFMQKGKRRYLRSGSATKNILWVAS